MGIDYEVLLRPAAGMMPDSRARMEREVIRSPIGNLCLIFCGNCGTPAARVPADERTRHAFVLCPLCAEQWGMIAHELVEPSLEFSKAVIRAQLETHKRVLSREEVARLMDDVNDPIARLIRQGG